VRRRFQVGVIRVEAGAATPWLTRLTFVVFEIVDEEGGPARVGGVAGGGGGVAGDEEGGEIGVEVGEAAVGEGLLVARVGTTGALTAGRRVRGWSWEGAAGWWVMAMVAGRVTGMGVGVGVGVGLAAMVAGGVGVGDWVAGFGSGWMQAWRVRVARRARVARRRLAGFIGGVLFEDSMVGLTSGRDDFILEKSIAGEFALGSLACL